MNPVPLTIDVIGLAEAAGEVQAIRGALADRSQLHAKMAVDAAEFTRAYVAGSNEHKTAQRLGAQPTGFRARAAKRIEADSDAEAAIVRIPRNTGLGRAFADITLVPGTGRTYLTTPACAETYGKVVRDFPEGTFKFAIFLAARGPCPALLWEQDGGSHKKDDVAWWLRRKVIQKQDRGLLPSDKDYQEGARDIAVVYLSSLRYHLL